MIFGLSDSDINKINSVFSLFPSVEKAILYGSRAKGSFRNGSDIDLALVGNQLNLATINAIGCKIDDLLLPNLLDISILHQITNRDLLEHIDRVGKVFYKKNIG